MRVWSSKMAIFASFVKSSEYFTYMATRHDSLYVMRLSMTLVIFQGH